MVGFGRLISDSQRFAYLADLYILPSYRRLGLGKVLLSCINDHPATRVYRQMTRLPTNGGDRNALRHLLENSGYVVMTPTDTSGMHTVRSVSVAVNAENRGIREWRCEKWPDYFASTDKGLLQLEVIHRYLSEESYWAKGVSMDAVRRRTDGSFCIGLYEKKLDGM
jgi:GNAT superfamily N-acetyltransferase